ncbi:hypothetical protein [Bradyrhizobium sp. USDA 4451]
MSNLLVLGSVAVVAASLIMVIRPSWTFGRKLSLDEAVSVCWVAWSIYMATFVIYIGLKLPLGLSSDAGIPAIAIGVLVSAIAVFCLARMRTDWKSAVTKSIFGLFTLTLVVVSITLDLTRSRN